MTSDVQYEGAGNDQIHRDRNLQGQRVGERWGQRKERPTNSEGPLVALVKIEGRGVHSMHSRRPSHPYNAGREHIRFSPIRQASRAPR